MPTPNTFAGNVGSVRAASSVRSIVLSKWWFRVFQAKYLNAVITMLASHSNKCRHSSRSFLVFFTKLENEYLRKI